jgi:hypothetical protein
MSSAVDTNYIFTKGDFEIDHFHAATFVTKYRFIALFMSMYLIHYFGIEKFCPWHLIQHTKYKMQFVLLIYI